MNDVVGSWGFQAPEDVTLIRFVEKGSKLIVIGDKVPSGQQEILEESVRVENGIECREKAVSFLTSDNEQRIHSYQIARKI